MPITLYDATIPTFLQILGSVTHLLNKAEAHCAEQGLPHEELINAKLYENMQPFSYQVKASAEHSLGAIEGLRQGSFSPSLEYPPNSFEALHERIDGAKAALAALDPAEINGFVGKDMCFAFKDRRTDFTAENFLFSFSLPNFYFHATTAYDVLRMKGVKIGKMDFLGQLRAKG
jgi:uncharacterized protein